MFALVETGEAQKRDPLVSIVIPVFNGLPYILQTIDSVRQQTYPHWELIICDNMSRDATVAAVREDMEKRPDQRIRLILHTQLLPMAENWNRSLTYAQSPFIKLLPADDILLPECLAIQQRILQETPDVGFVTCGKEVIDSAGRILFRRKPLQQGKYDWKSLGPRTLCAVVNILGEPGAILFRKDLLARTGMYQPGLNYFIDVELLLRFLKISDAYVWKTPLCQFRIHGRSTSASSRKIALDEYRKLLDRYGDELQFSRWPLLKHYLKIKSRLVVILRGWVFQLYGEGAHQK